MSPTVTELLNNVVVKVTPVIAGQWGWIDY